METNIDKGYILRILWILTSFWKFTSWKMKSFKHGKTLWKLIAEMFYHFKVVALF